MSDLIDRLNTIDASAKFVENYFKWHPKPPDPIACPHCGVLFQDRLRVLQLPDGRSRPVLMKAKVLLSIHAAAYSYNPTPGRAPGYYGMCGWKKEDRVETLANAKWPKGN